MDAWSLSLKVSRFDMGCVTAHCHQEEHQGYIKMLLCAAQLCGNYLQP